MREINTFSIVAFDHNKREWGVAVQSKFLAVGAVVSYGRAESGDVTTQAHANLAYGPKGLELMGKGMPAEDVIINLTDADDERESRQVGMVDREGNVYAYTGDKCNDWAGHIIGDGFACQGNILFPGTIEAMADAYENSRKGSGELADWLVNTLEAGQDAGGDKRGRQSAGVLVV